MTDNPFAVPWTTPFGIAPFAEIAPKHFPPAFATALAEHQAEIAAIAGNPTAPTIANTLDALELAGEALDRVSSVFWNLAGADTNDALQAIERDIAPVLAKHWSDIYMNEALFRRVEALYAARDGLALSLEQDRALDRTRQAFLRAGVALAPAAKARLADILQRLSTLGTTFSQNVLADEAGYGLVLDTEADLAGCPDFLRAAMAQVATDRGKAGRHMVTLSRSIIEPFLTFSTRRDLREVAFNAWIRRGEGGGATDNRAIVAEMVELRAERARLLGFPSFAHYKLDDQMAKTPDAVRTLLEAVWQKALLRAERERAELQALVETEGGNFAIEPWDWRFYAEKLRKAQHDFDEAALKPYLALDQIRDAAFDTAHRLFGVSFTERRDVPVYHPEVRAFEVTAEDGRHVGLFLADYYARPSKRSGAWMSSYRSQERLKADIRPIIVNVMNFSKPSEGKPALLSFDDARTLFHEFGHGLHGLLSDVTYPSLAGTNVARDFVELPSQLYEHWLSRPEVLSRFARHVDTREPMPQPLLDKLEAAKNFNQGFQTVEYTASALVDLDFHLLGSANGLDPIAFERGVLDKIGMPHEIVMRHRTPHFTHVFAGDGYSAGYYSYLWSEVLDADAFHAFTETGDVFDHRTATKLRDFIYAAGNTREPAQAYTRFRGRLPTIDALLEKRGLA